MRFHADDAQYTQTVMTTTGSLCCILPLAKQNFYANLGFIQPGCLIGNILCSHLFAVYDWVAAINYNNRFVGVKCPNQIAAAISDVFPTCNCSDTDIMGIYAEGKPGSYFFRTSNDFLPQPIYPGAPVLPIPIPQNIDLLINLIQGVVKLNLLQFL